MEMPQYLVVLSRSFISLIFVIFILLSFVSTCRFSWIRKSTDVVCIAAVDCCWCHRRLPDLVVGRLSRVDVDSGGQFVVRRRRRYLDVPDVDWRRGRAVPVRCCWGRLLLVRRRWRHRRRLSVARRLGQKRRIGRSLRTILYVKIITVNIYLFICIYCQKFNRK